MLSTEIINKSALAELYTKLTGLTYDIDTVIAETPADERIELFRQINWHIQKGLVLTQEGETQEMVKEFLPKICKELNVPKTFDLDNNGIIDVDEQAIKDSYVEFIDLGSDEDETDEPSEYPSEDATEAPVAFEDVLPVYETSIVSAEDDGEGGYDYFVTSAEGIKIKVKPCDWDNEPTEVTNNDLIAKSGVKTGKAKAAYEGDRIVLNDSKDIVISVPAELTLTSIEITGAGHKGGETSITPAETESNLTLADGCTGIIAADATSYTSTIVTLNVTAKAETYTIKTGAAKVWASIKFIGTK